MGKFRNTPYTNEEYLEKVREKYGDKYDLSLINYTDSYCKLDVICHKKDKNGNEHGLFHPYAYSFLAGHQCPACGNVKRLDTSEFIRRAKIVHFGKNYDFSITEYTSMRKPVDVICPKHGRFTSATARDFLGGAGCPICKTSKLEHSIRKLLDDNKIEYISQCGNKILPWIENLKLDFYLPNLKIGIECQGRQHFEVVNAFGGEVEFRKVVERDFKKKELSKTNGVELIYYLDKKFSKYMKEDDVYFTNLEDFIKYINDNLKKK